MPLTGWLNGIDADTFCRLNKSFRNPKGNSKRLFTWVLDDNQEVIFIWCDHYLIFLGPDSQKCEIILWVYISHSASSLHYEIVHLTSILQSG